MMRREELIQKYSTSNKDPAQAAKQAKLIAKGKVIAVDGSELEIEAQTICIHSDTPHALAIAGEVRMAMNK